MVKPLPTIRGIMKDDSITITGLLCRKGLRRLYKALGMPGYLRTEFLFPKKKKRGTARRKRRMKRAEQSFINFIRAKYSSGLIGTRATQPITDDFFIPEPLPVPPISREEYLEKASFSAPLPGPFEGEDFDGTN